jgi:hypothetical protein
LRQSFCGFSARAIGSSGAGAKFLLQRRIADTASAEATPLPRQEINAAAYLPLKN